MNKRTDYTFKYNKGLRRHGWLRLTPAYSVKLVEDILGKNDIFNTDKFIEGEIFDPFCGTATTGIVAAEYGLNCSLYEINPFLYWFSTVKGYNYDSSKLDNILEKIQIDLYKENFRFFYKSWVPPMKNIERWLDKETLKSLGKIHEYIKENFGNPTIHKDESILLWIAFSRLIIECSAADFGHISVSFKKVIEEHLEDDVIDLFISICKSIFLSAKTPIIGNVKIINKDARDVNLSHKIDYVITSPPYPNRISYIRELRPYMYWLGFLQSGEEAGNLDWSAIGGTWGSATSKLSTWNCNDWNIPQILDETVRSISNTESKNGDILAKYVLKFFYDMFLHFKNLKKNLNEGCKLFYIIGNSSFYGIMVDTENIIIQILNDLGYKNVNSRIIRKRNSKKDLFEYLITAQWN